MRHSFHFRSALLAAALAVAVASPMARAAPNPTQNGYPQNNDIGVVLNSAGTQQLSSTTTAEPSTQNNSWRGVTCRSLWSASSGSPTEVFSIEGYDAGTASWAQIATTGTTSAGNTPTSLTVYPGVAVSSLSSGQTAQSAVLPKRWRLKSVIAGSGNPGLTRKIGCNYID